MRILFIGKRHYTNKDAFNERFGRIYQLPRRWHATGHKVALALLDYHGYRMAEAGLDGFPVHSLPILYAPYHIHRIALHLRPELVVASGDCLVGLIGMRLAKRHHARFVFDVYDDYRTFGAYRAFLGWNVFNYLIARTTMTWYASRALADTQPQPKTLVPNGVDSDIFRPMPQDHARTLAGLDKGARWIGYFGSTEAARGVDDLVAAVGQLYASNPSIRLVICGGGVGRARLVAPWVDDRGNVPHAQIPVFINACDVITLPYRRGAGIDMVSSCKMAEYLFCERPIVATDTPSLRANFPQQAAELGQAIAQPGDEGDLARAIAYQLQAMKITSRPQGFVWANIADAALSTLVG